MFGEVQIKAAVTVSEMARMVGLSRARFNQLKGTTFPFPLYDVNTKRPFYPEDLQKVCLEVRRRNCGIDGKPILFYARRNEITPVATKPRKRKTSTPKTGKHSEIVEGVKALGLTSVTATEVADAVKTLFPNGTSILGRGEVVRQVFLHIQRKNAGDNLGR